MIIMMKEKRASTKRVQARRASLLQSPVHRAFMTTASVNRVISRNPIPSSIIAQLRKYYAAFFISVQLSGRGFSFIGFSRHNESINNDRNNSRR